MEVRIGRSLRFLRIRAGWRQSDLASSAGVSRELVSRVERGAAASVTIGALLRLAAAVDSTLSVEFRWRGEHLDRLVDAGHAALEESGARRLRAAEWRVEAEVSFNHFGDRGRIDLLCFHEASGVLLVVEAKTRIVDIQDMLGRLDVKVRLGAEAAMNQGWPRPRRVVPCLQLADTRSARRIVAAHPELFARFNLRGRAAERWLTDPGGPGDLRDSTAAGVTGLLWFEKVADSHRVTPKRAIRAKSVPNVPVA